MDINKWLAETAVPDERDLADQLGLPSFLQSKENLYAAPGRERRKRKRELPSSNSSYIEAERNTKPANILSRALHKDQSSESDASHVLSSDSQASNSEPENAEDKYRRKARYKTKPDRYNPKDGKKRQESKKHTDKRKEPREKRKLKRRKREKPGIGLIQSFHANNVSKDRLTLKPTQSIGLFKKGRASSPRRGKGLPDLTFSEMRFLQKGTHDDQENMQQSAKNARRKERARGKDAEISEYFNTKRPPVKEKDLNIESKPYAPPRQDSITSSLGRRRQTSVRTGSVRPTVELPEKPFLGYGGRCANHTETSCFSWSESPRQPSHPPSVACQSASDNVRHDRTRGVVYSNGSKPVRHPSQLPITPTRIPDRTLEEHAIGRPTDDPSYAERAVERRVSRSTSHKPQTRGQPFGLDRAPSHEQPPKQVAPSNAERHVFSSGARPLSNRHSFHYDQGIVSPRKLPGSADGPPPVRLPAIRCSSEQPQRYGQDQVNNDSKQEAISEQRTDGRHEVVVEVSKSSSSLERLLKDCDSAFERPSGIKIPARVGLNLEVESILVQGRQIPQAKRPKHPPVQVHQSQQPPPQAPAQQRRPPSRPGFIRRPELYFGEEIPEEHVQPVMEYPWNRVEDSLAADLHRGLFAQEQGPFVEEVKHFEHDEVEEEFDEDGGEEYSQGHGSRDEVEQQQHLQLRYDTLGQNGEDIFAGFWRPNRLY